jgi:DNA-binding SARP family transcriptional activator
MIELRTLGPAALRDSGGRDVDTVLRQPKRLALLAYLAIASPRGFCRRDTLLGVFWPDLDDGHARNALGQTLHGLRASLGSGVVVSRGTAEVGLSDQRLWCDAAAFAKAFDAGDRGGALALYRGDLLEGFFLADAPEFERWLERECSRLRRTAAEAATGLAEDSAQAGEAKAAAEWALRAMSLAPYDEGALRQLVTLLDTAGDRAQALAVYERFVRRLAADLEVEPSPETKALIEAVRTRTEMVRATSAASAVVNGPTTPGPTQAVPKPSGRSPDAPDPPPPGRHVRRVGTVLTVGASTIVLMLAAAAWLGRDHPGEPAVDADVVMIAPFRVAADGSFEYLREGLVDLLATRLNGETGSRAVDPRSAIAAWRGAVGHERDELTPAVATALARGLGAGQVLMGSVVGTPERLMLDATLYDATRATVRTRISMQGPADSVPALIDALAGQILARDANVPRHQLEQLTTTSLEALRLWLEGRSSYRQGRFGEAVAQLEAALSRDSTFALAAVHLGLAADWGQLTSAPGTRDRALRLAWAARGRLSTPDRLFLEAMAGPRYPDPTPRHELHAARVRALNAAPDQPEALALMGRFHWGGVVRGESRAEERSTAFFRQALALDSTFAAAAYPLARGAAGAGDTAAVRRMVRGYLAADSISETAQLLGWMAAATLGDVPALLDLRARMPTMHPTALGWIAAYAQLFGVDLDGAEAALAALGATARSERELLNYAGRRLELLGNLGRLGEQARLIEERVWGPASVGGIDDLGMSARDLSRSHNALARITTALFWGGDTTGIGEAMTLIEEAYRRSPAPDGTPFARVVVAESACFAGMGRIMSGDAAAARGAVARLHELLEGGLELPSRASHATCAATLNALVAVAEARPDARELAERADSILRHDPPSRLVANRMHLLLARAFDALDDPETALRVIRRRELNNPPFYLATILAEEGRLAVRAGDRAGAIQAYRHYLALRTDPDPELTPEVGRIREELSALLDD